MTAHAMYYPRTPRPAGQNFAETTLDSTPRTDASMSSPNAARTHGKQLPASPLRREASNLLARGLLARLHGGGDAGNKSAKRTLQSLPTFLRPHTTAVRPPLTEDGQPPSLQSRERSFFGPRAVSEPKPRTPLPSIDQVNSEVEVRRKREEDVTRRVEAAMEETRRAKEKQREDVLAGVPRHYAFKPPKCLVIYEDDLQRFRRKRRKANREARLAERRRAASEGGKAPGRRVSPSRTVFPKVTDFISREQTRIDMDNATLEWTLPTRSYHHSQPAVQRPAACGVSGGKLCRSFYPVTEALHREGTSVSKLKGRSLAPGDCLVAKVWPRNLQKFATPLEMATEDRRFFYRGQLAVSQRSSQQRLGGLVLEHEGTLYERQQMEEQFLEQMQLQQMEQRRLEEELVHRERSREEQQAQSEQYEQPDQEQQEEHHVHYEQTEQEQIIPQEREITEQRLHEHQLQPALNENAHNEEPTVEEKERHKQEGEKRLHLHIEILQAVEKEGDEDVEEEDEEEEDDEEEDDD